MIVSKLQNYVGVASSKIKGSIGSTILDSINNDQGVLNSVLGKVSYLKKTIDLASCWTNMFSCLINDIPTEENVKTDVHKEIISDIDYARDQIIDGVDFIRDNYGNEFTIIDSSGMMYNLYLKSEEWVEKGHSYKSIIKTSVRQSKEDCLIFIKDGKLFFNQQIRSTNFRIPLFNNSQNILDAVGNYCSQHKENFDGTLNSIPGSGSLLSRLQNLGATGDNIFTMVKSLNTDLPFYSGKIKLWWDVLRDYIQSSELNANILEVINALSAGSENFKAFMSTVAVRINNAMSAIKKFWIDLSNAFAQGGFKGAVYFIYHFFRTGASMVDKDGLLSFTDNSLLVPKQYIAGMVVTIVTAVTTLIGIIATALSPVLGATIGAAGVLLYGIYKSISWDSSRTRIGIQTGEDVLVPAFPWAVFQDTFTPNSDILELMNDYPVLLFEVPGGYYLVGPGSINDDGKITSARGEFHASACQKVPFNYFDNILGDCARQEESQRTVYDVTIDFTTYPGLHTQLEQAWQGRGKVQNIENVENEAVDDENDGYLSQLMTFNTFYFLYWYANLVHNTFHRYAGSYKIGRWNTATLIQSHFCNVVESVTANESDNWVKMMILCCPYEAWPSTWLPSLARHYDANRGFAAATWAKISEMFTEYQFNNVNQGLPFGFLGYNKLYFGDPIIAPNSFSWAVVAPVYDSDTFLRWIVIANIALAVISVAAVVATFKIKKFIQNKRAEMNASVESSWDDYKKGEISYNDYRKTVKKANRWQSIIGGTRYDYENYWNGDVSETDGNTQSSDPNSVSTVSSVCTDLINKIYYPEQSIADDEGLVSVDEIKRLIVGS